MGKPEASMGVVRIGVSVGVLVVNSVISHPVVDVLLAGHRLTGGEEDSEGERKRDLSSFGF